MSPSPDPSSRRCWSWARRAPSSWPAPAARGLRTAGLPSSATAVRILGVGELAIAAWALGWGGRGSAAAVALDYVGFAGFAEQVRRRSRGRASCGCFGASGAPLSRLHVAIDLVVAAVAVVAVVDPVPGLLDAAADTPAAGIAFVGYTLLLAWLLEVALTALPELQAAMRPARGAAR
ncbi:MAG: hypothetical protein R2746_07105 [Acidimicrobiales bacterium]